MIQIDIVMLLLIILISAVIITIFLKLKKDKQYKLIVLGLGTSVCIYSGIGIAYEHTNNVYLFHYLVYLISIISGFYFVVRKKVNSNSDKIGIVIKLDRNINGNIVLVLTCIYLVSLLLFLIIPELRLKSLIIPPSLNVFGVSTLRNKFETNTILNIASIISVLTFPFFLILIKKMLSRGKKKITLLLIAYWGYLDYAIYEYIGRSEMLTYVIFAYLVSQFVDDDLKINKRKIMLLASVFVLTIPLLHLFESLRLNNNFTQTSIVEIYYKLFTSETSYTRYYDILYNIDQVYGIREYLLWIVTLPIPKFLFPVEITTFNVFFTNLIDHSLEYLVLPSILGESFMIFGKYFFWVHAIIIGGIIGIAYNVLIKYRFSSIILLYIGVLTFSIGRGGSMQIISFCINSLLVLWVGIIVSRLLNNVRGRNTN